MGTLETLFAKSNKTRVFYGLVLTVFALALPELTLRLLAFVSRTVDQLLTPPSLSIVSDPRLGYRPNPAYEGHDAKGFRNPKVPARAYIVALGDSQTYGTGVKPEDAWPRRLESMTAKTVYSMAYGGYGPTHSLLLWDEAVALSPTIIIEAFYAGNDLFDSFDHVYNQAQLTDLESADRALRASIREAEKVEPIQKRVSQLFEMGRKPGGRFSSERLRRSLLRHSSVYGLLEKLWYEATRLINESSTPEQKWAKAKAFAAAHQEYQQAFSNAQFKTIFTTEYRRTALNLEDPRIQEGLKISLRVFDRMQKLAAAENIRFIVLLIPTKEAVFRQLWQSPSKSYLSLIENEQRVWRSVTEFLEHNGIEYLDVLPVLQEQLARGIQPYQVSADGHPNEAGHNAIARSLAARLALSNPAQAN